MEDNLIKSLEGGAVNMENNNNNVSLRELDIYGWFQVFYDTFMTFKDENASEMEEYYIDLKMALEDAYNVLTIKRFYENPENNVTDNK